MSRDPIGYMDDTHPYRYVKNSPLIYTDRDGMKAKAALKTGVTFGLKVVIGAGDLFIGGIEYAGDDQEYNARSYEEDTNLQLHGAIVPGVALGRILVKGGVKFLTKETSVGSKYLEGIISKSPDFIVSPKGTVFPVPKNAIGPVPNINNAGNVTGVKFINGEGGVNGQVSTMRIMNPTQPKGNSPGYPNGYIKYDNSNPYGVQPVNPYSGKPGSQTDTHFPIY